MEGICRLTRTSEYLKWKQLNAWISANTKYYNNYQTRELLNCITRYFTSMTLSRVDEDTVYAKFLEEVAAKNLKVVTDIRKIEESRNISIPSHFCVKFCTKFVRFTCGDFTGELPIQRYEILKVNLNTTDQDVLCMLLSYGIFPSASLSWSVPHSIYKHLFETHGLTLEGCSSPINSQMLLLGAGDYCTPFDSDKVFGSAGNIFSQNLEGHISLLNPPFVEDFMLRLAKKSIETIEKAVDATTIIYIAPAWIDAQSHVLLSNTKHLVQKFDLSKGTYYYEDAVSQTKIPAKFDSTIFVISNTDVDYSDILTFFT